MEKKEDVIRTHINNYGKSVSLTWGETKLHDFVSNAKELVSKWKDIGFTNDEILNEMRRKGYVIRPEFEPSFEYSFLRGDVL